MADDLRLTETREVDWRHLSFQAGRVFKPRTPIDDETLFAGRVDQIRRVVDAIGQPGLHAILFGERGVGKSSLANVLATFLPGDRTDVLAPRVNCESADTFDVIWRKVLARIGSEQEKAYLGFHGGLKPVRSSAAEMVEQEQITADTVRRVLTDVAEGVPVLVLIIDEFDRLSQTVRIAFADLIKTLSDQAVDATVLMVGVADDVDDLIDSHHSVSRALVQIHLPRMTPAEIEQIVVEGVTRLGMTIESNPRARIVLLSQGLPHYTHLIALHAVRVAADARTLTITEEIVNEAISKSIEDAHHTIRKDYSDGTYSARKDNLFGDVLLACALARTDESGFFAAQDVIAPLRAITEKPYQIPTFSQHLNDFSSSKRGNMLVKDGSPRRYRYRFSDPLMQPYVVMMGLSTGRIPRSLLEAPA